MVVSATAFTIYNVRIAAITRIGIGEYSEDEQVETLPKGSEKNDNQNSEFCEVLKDSRK